MKTSEIILWGLALGIGAILLDYYVIPGGFYG